MRIAFVISTLEKCGPVNVLFETAKYLIANGDNVLVITLAKESPVSRLDDFKKIGATVVCACETRLGSFISGAKNVEKLVKDFNADLVHAHGYRADIVCSKLRLPKTSTVHNRLYEDFRTSYSKLQALFMSRTEVSALKKMDAVICCSKSSAEYLKKHHSLDALVVQNGVNQDVFSPPSPDEKKTLREELGFSIDFVHFISTGGCSERKGTLPLIESFLDSDAAADAVLHIAGEGPLFSRCLELANSSNGKVQIHGRLDGVEKYLKASDVFVSNSYSEGLPLAVLEALSCGLPAVLSDIPSHREIAEIDSELPIEIYSSVERMPSIAYASANCETPFTKNLRAMKKLSSRKMADDYCAIYSSLVKSGKHLNK